MVSTNRLEVADKPKRAKRGQGEGHPRQRKDGLWEIQVSLGTKPDGTRDRRSVYGKTRADTTKRARELHIAYERGMVPASASEKVEDFLNRWLETAQPGNTPKGREYYASTVRVHLIPALGRIRLDKLTVDQVERMMRDEVARGLSPRTATISRNVLRAALNRAIRWGIISRNVAAIAEPPQADLPTARPLTMVEVQRLLKAASGDRLEALIQLTLATGLRRGELLGLHWADVDPERRCIHVRTQVQRVDGTLVVRRLKERASHATIPLAPFAADALRRHRVRQYEERLQAGAAWQDHDLVFPTILGTPTDPRNFHRSWDRLRKAAKITNRLHDLRHTCATMLHAQGVPAKDIQAILRHAQLSTTMDIYTHIWEGSLQAASDALERLFGGSLQTGGGTSGGTNEKAEG